MAKALRNLRHGWVSFLRLRGSLDLQFTGTETMGTVEGLKGGHGVIPGLPFLGSVF